VKDLSFIFVITFGHVGQIRFQKPATAQTQTLGAINFWTVTRKDHLAYCSVCINRKFTNEFGFICKLTDKKADFNDNCDNFSLDNKQRENRNRKYRDEVDASIEKRRTFLKQLLNSGPYLGYLNIADSSTHFPVNTNLESIIMESRNKKKLLLYAIILFPCVIGYSIYRDGMEIKNIEWFFLGFGLLWILLIYLYRDNKEIFRIGRQGIIVKKNHFIPWHKIDFIHLKTVPQDMENSVFLILKIEDLEDIEISIEHADKDVGQIAALTYQYIKACKKN